LGKLSAPAGLLTLFGIILTAILVFRKVPGAIILAVLAVTIIGLFVPGEKGGRVTTLPAQFFSMPASIAPTFLKLDFNYFFKNLANCLPLVFALLFVDLFDNMGTLIGVCQKAGLLDARGNLPKIGRALTADASAAMIGACLGTSTTTSYIESAAGVEEGGRTGLTSLVVAACFLLALFLSPIILAIPAVATAPALVIVGVFMMQGIAEINLKDFAVAVPAVLTILVMPLSFSISEGIAIGFVVYAALMVGIGRAKQVSVIAYCLALLFLVHFFLRS
jgi:AGZA family xanthine/uracil permease-like MFS transporter